MSASTTTNPYPYWVGTPTIDLIAAADDYEMSAERILTHPHTTSEDRELAEFLTATAADLRTEIARRTNA